MRRHNAIIIAAILVVISFANANSQFTGSASGKYARKIIRRHVNAIGGGDALSDIQAMKIVGYMQAQGFEFDFALYLKRPNWSRMDMSFQGIDIVQAWDGTDAWWVNPMFNAREPQEMPEDIKNNLLKWVDFDGPLVDFRAKHHKADHKGVITLGNGQEVHDIELRHANGETWHIYLDSETYLEAARQFPQTFQGRTDTVTTYLSEYKDVEGVMMKTKIEGIALDGSPYKMVFETFEVLGDLDDDMFHMPGSQRGDAGMSDYIYMTGISDLIEPFNGDDDRVRTVVLLSPS